LGFIEDATVKSLRRGGGLNLPDRKRNTFSHYRYNPNNPRSDAIMSLSEDRDRNFGWQPGVEGLIGSIAGAAYIPAASIANRLPSTVPLCAKAFGRQSAYDLGGYSLVG
jgi:hypothetical protein